MSKKDDKISLLKHHNACWAAAFTHVARALGVEVADDIGSADAMNLARSLAAQVAGIAWHRPAARPANLDAQDRAAWKAARRAGSSSRGIGLAGGTLHTSDDFADMDEEIDRANAKLNPDEVARIGRSLERSEASPEAFWDRVQPGAEAVLERGGGPPPSYDKLWADRNASWIAVNDMKQALGITVGTGDSSLGFALRAIRDEMVSQRAAITANNADAFVAINELARGLCVVDGVVGQSLGTAIRAVKDEVASQLGWSELHSELAVALSKGDSTAQPVPDDTGRAWVAINDIAQELDIDAAFDASEGRMVVALEGIRAEILRIKNPSGDVSADAAGALSKGDSLAQAIGHNRDAQANLELALAEARGIIQRVAGAMQIGQWDADGTELIERAQRWDGFKHALRKSLDVWRARASSGSGGIEEGICGGFVIELSGFLALLTSHKDLAAWLKNKPKVAALAGVLDVAEATPVGKLGRPFGLTDLDNVLDHSNISDSSLYQTMCAICVSRAANAEFVNMMNLVILPILARQGA